MLTNQHGNVRITKTTTFANTDTNYKILFQNFQSLYNKQHLLEAFIQQNPKYQAICISESWLSEAKLEMIKLGGFKVAASFCRSFRTGGGVCILLQENIEHKEITEISNMSIEYVLEACAIELSKQLATNNA